jgi:hypothetical protein
MIYLLVTVASVEDDRSRRGNDCSFRDHDLLLLDALGFGGIEIDGLLL